MTSENHISDTHSRQIPITRVRKTTPTFYEQATTTTTTTTINKEFNSTIDEMTTTQLERSPIRRVNLVSGPRSAFARLFPERYRQEQEELQEKQRSKSSEDHRYDFDRIARYPHLTQVEDQPAALRRSQRVTFEDQRTKSEPFLNETTHHYQNISSLSTENVAQIPLNYDPEPEIIYRDNPEKLVYVQRVGVRYLKPPTPPPPGALVIREVQATPPQEPPPLVVSTTPPVTPRTPSPWIVREQPPTPPQPQPTQVITKTLPAPPAPPRRVIIKRVPPLPAKPRPVIIEKWLPYKSPPERPVLYERAEIVEPPRSSARNVILQYEPAQVRVEQEIQNVGCFRVDPEVYRTQFGSSLRRTDSIRRVLQDIGCNPDILTNTGYQSNDHSASRPRPNTTCFTDEQLAELVGASQPTGTTTTASHRYRNSTLLSYC